MITERGRVVAVANDSLWVETVRSSTCSGCSARKGCGHGLLSGIGEGRRNYLRVLPGELPLADVAVDDQVEIAIPENVLLIGAAIVYLLPLLAMLAGTLVGSSLSHGDGAAIAGAVLGLVSGLGLVRLHSLVRRNDPHSQPRLVAVVHNSTALAASPSLLTP